MTIPSIILLRHHLKAVLYEGLLLTSCPIVHVKYQRACIDFKLCKYYTAGTIFSVGLII